MEEKNTQPKIESTTDNIYLDKLQFDPELKKSWMFFFIKNFRVVILLLILISAWGIYAFFSLSRESMPEVKLPIAVVMTTYPGASPTDVEEFVTKKIENKLTGLDKLDTITSQSLNSASVIVVQFQTDADIDNSIRSLRDKVKEAETEISSEAETPIVTQISLDDSPIWTIALSGPFDGFELRKYAEQIQGELEKIAGVREVQVNGGDIHQFEIAYLPEKLNEYGLTALTVNQIIQSYRTTIPAGNFENGDFIIPVESDLKMNTVEDIENIPLYITPLNSYVYLKDVAVVSSKAIKRTVITRLSTDGETQNESVNISIIKRQGVSILDTVDEAEKVLLSELNNLPSELNYVVTTDNAEIIRADFERLTHDFILTIFLVAIVLFLIVGLKEAFVAGLAIPLVFFISFGLLLQFGYTLNFLSLFSLILSLGLLVDDAIVVVSAVKQYTSTGKWTPEEAVLLVLKDFRFVLVTTTLANTWAFVPLIFTTGIIGEFMKSLPVTVSITLLSSLAVAVIINPSMSAMLERVRLQKKGFLLIGLGLTFVTGILMAMGGWMNWTLAGLIYLIILAMVVWYYFGGKEKMAQNLILSKIEQKDDNAIKEKIRLQNAVGEQTWYDRLLHGVVHFHRVLPVYEKLLRKWILPINRRVAVLGIVLGLFIFSVALIPLGVVEMMFFPNQDGDQVYIDIKAPVGTTLAETDKMTDQILAQLIGRYDDVQDISISVGQSNPENMGLSLSGGGNPNESAILLSLKDSEEREKKSFELADEIRENLSVPSGLSVEVKSPARVSPQTGSVFQARIVGDDLTKISVIAQELKHRLAEVPGVINIQLSQKEAVPEYTFRLNPAKLAENNLTAVEVAATLRLAISGIDLFKIVVDNEEIQLTTTFDKNQVANLSDIQNLSIVNSNGVGVFLKDVARVELQPSVNVINHYNAKRVITLSADASGQTNSNKILAGFQEQIKDYVMPSGYEIVYGGENEQNNESVMSIINAMLVALVLIIATLVVQFNSFRKVLITLIPIPLSLIGVFIGMGLLGVPLSFPGLIGTLALFGIVVKNSIILVDKITMNVKNDIPLVEAVVDAGKSRLEAIFITSICTVLGMLPITFSNPMWMSLGGAIICGSFVSSFLTLFIVPAVYLLLERE